MVPWATLLAATIGGLLAVSASVVSFRLEQRRQAAQWRRELLTDASGDLLAAMQRYMREILSLAYAAGPPYTRELIDDIEHVFPGADERLPAQQVFDGVISDWNGALHRLLIVAPRDLVELSRSLDCELDRLLDLAIDHRWSREQFRAERRLAGTIAANFVVAARRVTSVDSIELANVWTWAADDEVSTGNE